MRKKTIKRVVAGLLTASMAFGVVAFTTACGSTDTASSADASSAAAATDTSVSGSLTITGSTSMQKVVSALGEAFMAKYPNVQVTKGGNGSGEAAPAVVGGTADIGDLSRSLKDSENPSQFTVTQVAIDGIGIALNTANSVTNLTTDQVTKIFTGEITNWKDVGGSDAKITVIGREAASGTRDGFESIFKVKDKCKYEAQLNSTGAVVSRVQSDPNAIGYISLDSVNGVKASNIDGVAATEANVVNGSYPVKRPFIEIYKKGSDSVLVKKWFEFVKSTQGQEVIKTAGVIPYQAGVDAVADVSTVSKASSK